MKETKSNHTHTNAKISQQTSQEALPQASSEEHGEVGYSPETKNDFGYTPPNVQQTITRLYNAPGQTIRRQMFSSLQRAYGNAYVARVAINFNDKPKNSLQRHADHDHTDEMGAAGAVQRHPEGTALASANPAAANAEIARPPRQAAGAASTPAAPEAAPAAPEAASAAPEVSSATVETVIPIKPGTMPTLTLASSQAILKTSFGKIHEIVQGTIVILDNQDACHTKYDEINKGRPNPYNGRQPWADGDAKKYIPGLQGFADAPTVYINKETRLTSTTVHEMLHINTASGFRAAVGETINEGTTEILALKALADASVTPTAGVEAYPTQRNLVKKLIGLVGEETLTKAYFNGAASLVEAFETLQGVGSFAKLKTAMEALDSAKVTELVKPVPKAT